MKAKIRLRDTGKKRKDGTPIYTSILKFHHLRHTCLSWLGDTGANDMVIKAIAGHADADVTDRYVHIALTAMREAVEWMERTKLQPDEGEQTAAQRAS